MSVYREHGVTTDMLNLDHNPSDDDRFRLGTNEETALHTLFRANIPADVEEFNTWLQRINDADVANVYFISKGDCPDSESASQGPAVPV